MAFTVLWLTPAMAGTVAPAPSSDADSGRTAFILGVSWQPAFCEGHSDRKECQDQTALRADATRFSLHGLWPVKKSYCGVAADMRARDRKGNWLDLPQIAMQPETAAKLLVAMPGMRSGLDRHQWLRSGTCQGGTAQDYFALQLRYLDELNASAVSRLFADRIGEEVTEAQIKQAFDESFGAMAGERVRMRCEKDGERLLVSGLTIGLSADRSGTAGLGPLILAAGPTDFKCAKGIIDPAGLQ